MKERFFLFTKAKKGRRKYNWRRKDRREKITVIKNPVVRKTDYSGGLSFLFGYFRCKSQKNCGGMFRKKLASTFFSRFLKEQKKSFFVFRKKLFCCWFLFLFPIFWVFGLSAFVICYETFISLHRHETDRLFSLFWIFISCTASKNFVLKLLLIFL